MNESVKEQSKKLENVKTSITKVRKVLQVLTTITKVGFILCIVGVILAGVYAKPLNKAIQQSVQEGTGIFTVEVSNEFVGGIVKGDMDLQQLADKGEYATVIMITVSINAAMLLIMYVIMKKLIRSILEIEKSETPFSKSILASFKQVFILVSIMVGIMSDVSVLITVIVVFVCIYKIIEYGITLQDEIDQIL